MIVLHTTKYGDTSLIVHGYTLEHGRESFLLRGAASGKCRHHPTALLHPLSLLEITASENPSGNLRYLKEFTPEFKLDTIRSNMSKVSIAVFISEFLYKCLRESTPDPEMYRFITESIIRLESYQGSCSNFHLWFLIRFAEISGFPPISGFENEYDPFNSEQKQILETIGRISCEEAMSVPMTGSLRGELSMTLVGYIGFHLGININILSAGVLHEIFS